MLRSPTYVVVSYFGLLLSIFFQLHRCDTSRCPGQRRDRVLGTVGNLLSKPLHEMRRARLCHCGSLPSFCVLEHQVRVADPSPSQPTRSTISRPPCPDGALKSSCSIVIQLAALHTMTCSTAVVSIVLVPSWVGVRGDRAVLRLLSGFIKCLGHMISYVICSCRANESNSTMSLITLCRLDSVGTKESPLFNTCISVGVSATLLLAVNNKAATRAVS